MVTHVQSKSSVVSVQNQQQIQATFDSPVAIDNWIYVFAYWQDTASGGSMAQTIDSVTGGTGNTYGNLTQWQNSANTGRCQVWRVKNQHNAAHTITVHFSATVGNRITLDIIEVAGAHATNAAIEQAAIGQTISESSVSAGSVATLDENSLIVTAVHTFSSRTFSAPSPGFTIGATQSAQGAIAYLAAPTISSYSATWNWSDGNSTALGLIIAIRPTTTPTTFPSIGTPSTLTLRDIELNKGLN